MKTETVISPDGASHSTIGYTDRFICAHLRYLAV
jgi:hypothetical protein